MSSKLLSADAITSAVPWLACVKPFNPEPVPLHLDPHHGIALEPRLDAPAVSQSERDDRGVDPFDGGQEHPSVIADHSACDAEIQSLQSEIHRLTVLVGEEKRVAYQQGLEAGTAQEASKWAEALARSAKAVADIAAYKPRLRAQVEAEAVRLSLAIARKVLRREANTDPEAIAGLVRVALEKVSVRDVLRIRVSAKDAGDLKSRLADMGLPAQVELILDQSLERGGVVVDTGQGHVDVSIETQLQEIERGLADALERERRR